MDPCQGHDALGRLAQAGGRAGVMLFRLTGLEGGNRYTALPVEFDADGATEPASDEPVTVTNLAEPADADGAIPAGTEAVGVDVEGRWVVFLRPVAAGAFPARILASAGGAAYTVREQLATGPGQFTDKPGAADATAHNLAELSLGPGAAVEDDTIVLVTALSHGAETRHVFDHPAYAKYLD